MNRMILGVLLGLSLFTAVAAAGEPREIELKDGSVITGDVLSLAGGVYTIKSDSLGMIKLEESRIREIRSKPSVNGSAPRNAATGSGSEVRAIQERMTSDKEVMGMIQSLQNDPEFKRILEDPEMLKAIESADVAALMANPQFMKLLNNPTVREIEKKVK